MRRRLTLISRLCAALLLVALSATAEAQPASFEQLSSTSFDEVRRGVEALAASGDPVAAPVLGALQAGRLFASPDNTLFVRDPNGIVTNALTGAPAPASLAPRPVRVNNTVRRAVDAAMGGLRLFAPDPATRAIAAAAVLKSRDAAALPALDQALARETDGAIRRTMQQARAAALLAGADTPEADRLAAVAVLRARGDLDARGLLASLGPQPEAVQSAATAAVATIDWNLRLWGLLQGVYYGLIPSLINRNL